VEDGKHFILFWCTCNWTSRTGLPLGLDKGAPLSSWRGCRLKESFQMQQFYWLILENLKGIIMSKRNGRLYTLYSTILWRLNCRIQ
jgi:hypothetical protein